MFSKKMFKGIRPRLVLSMTLLLFLSLFFVAGTIYFLLSTSLRKSDRSLLLNLRQTYTQLFLDGGPSLLANRISPEIFFAVVDKESGNHLFEHMPSWIDHDFEDEAEIKQLRKSTQQLLMVKGWQSVLLLSGEEDHNLFEKVEYQLRLFVQRKDWQTILPLIDNDLFEVYSAPLNERYWIRIGKSSEVREESLARIRTISFAVIIPFIFIGFLLSILLAKNILRPIEELAKTIGLIKDGHTDSRAQVRGTEDEIDLLTSGFNSLLDRNRSLIINMRETVDNVAHDLRTPLTRFRINAEYALLNQSEAPELRSSLADAVENSDGILKLLDTIMVVSEAESQTIKLNLQRTSVSVLLSSVVELYEHVSEERGIRISVDCSSELFVNCDPRRLIQALGNLLDNAIKYSKSNTRIDLRGEGTTEKVCIVFKDSGQGISDDDLPRIWTRLYRAEESRSTPGSGIGLSLVKAIVEAHRGSVRASSKLGAGSVFTVELPRCNVHVMNA